MKTGFRLSPIDVGIKVIADECWDYKIKYGVNNNWAQIGVNEYLALVGAMKIELLDGSVFALLVLQEF